VAKKKSKKDKATAIEAATQALVAQAAEVGRGIVHPDNEGYRERVTPKTLEPNVHLWKCSCGSLHFRHAGYVRHMLPFLESGDEKRVAMENLQVMVCVACKRSTVWSGKQMYDVTDHVDLKAWEKTEKEMHAATGPGGQC
jgi:hypothetical protein